MKNSVPKCAKEKQNTSRWLAKKQNGVRAQDAGATVHLIAMREEPYTTKTLISSGTVSRSFSYRKGAFRKH